MVSIERLEPFEFEKYCFPHFRNGTVERSFPSRLYSDFDSLFHYDKGFVQKDMEFGSTLLDSIVSPAYHGSGHGRYTAASPFSSFQRMDVHESSDVNVIPIKVEHCPDTYHDQKNVRFRLLNGSAKQTEVNRSAKQIEVHKKASSLLVGEDFPEFIDFTSSHSPACQPPKDHQRGIIKNLSNVGKLTDSLSNLALSANRSGYVDDSRHTMQKSFSEYDSHEKETDFWKSIPVHHVDSANNPTSDKKPNLNNNSSGKKEFLSPKNIPSKVSTSKAEDELDVTSSIVSRDASVSSIPSVTNGSFESEFEEHEVNAPPSYPIYDVLKVQLAVDNRKIDYIRGDGNCFFRAISKGLYGSEVYHKTVRNVIVDIIATNSSKFAQFVDAEDVQAHVTRMAENHCWATTCEIYAAATLLQRDIFMLTPDHLNKNYSWLLFKPIFKVEEALSDTIHHHCYITLCNTNGNHYDRVVADHGGCNCFLPHPELGTVGVSHP